MYRVFLDYIRQLAVAEDAAALQNLLKIVAESYELPTFAYLLMPQNGKSFGEAHIWKWATSAPLQSFCDLAGIYGRSIGSHDRPLSRGERTRRAKIINAQGEQQATEKLVEAANILQTEP